MSAGYVVIMSRSIPIAARCRSRRRRSLAERFGEDGERARGELGVDRAQRLGRRGRAHRSTVASSVSTAASSRSMAVSGDGGAADAVVTPPPAGGGWGAPGWGGQRTGGGAPRTSASTAAARRITGESPRRRSEPSGRTHPSRLIRRARTSWMHAEIVRDRRRALRASARRGVSPRPGIRPCSSCAAAPVFLADGSSSRTGACGG